MNGKNYQRQGTGRPHRPPIEQIEDFASSFQPAWVENGITEEGVRFTERLGKALSRNLSTSQIRAVYGELKRIQVRRDFSKERTSFLLLKPKMAYAVTRNRDKSGGLDQLNKVFSKAYEAVKADTDGAQQRFNHLVEFMEAVLAYHEAFGGK